MLLDADEPFWRFRDRAPPGGRAQISSNPPDPAYQRIAPTPSSPADRDRAGGRVRPVDSGTRTLVMLNDATWPASGATVTIDAVRPRQHALRLRRQTARVTTLPLEGRAPWDEED